MRNTGIVSLQQCPGLKSHSEKWDQLVLAWQLHCFRVVAVSVCVHFALSAAADISEFRFRITGGQLEGDTLPYSLVYCIVNGRDTCAEMVIKRVPDIYMK